VFPIWDAVRTECVQPLGLPAPKKLGPLIPGLTRDENVGAWGWRQRYEFAVRGLHYLWD